MLEPNLPSLQNIVQRRKPPGVLLFDSKGTILSWNSTARWILDRQFGLSPREIEAVQSLENGMTDKEIASALGITTDTARRYVKTIRGKLGVSTRTAIVHKLRSL